MDLFGKKKIETLKQNNKILNQRNVSLYKDNIEYQNKIKTLNENIERLRKENKTLKSKNTKLSKQLKGE